MVFLPTSLAVSGCTNAAIATHTLVQQMQTVSKSPKYSHSDYPAETCEPWRSLQGTLSHEWTNSRAAKTMRQCVRMYQTEKHLSLSLCVKPSVTFIHIRENPKRRGLPHQAL